VPTDFLTDDHLRVYASFHSEPTLGDLEQHCQLGARDIELILERRSNHSRLGFAVQLCTLRLLHAFPNDFSGTPATLVEHVARQLQIDPNVLPRYLERRNTRFEHQREIRTHLGYREFGGVHAFGAIRFLLARLAVADERPITLFQALVSELQRTRVELPGASTLTRLILKTRERVALREHKRLASKLSRAQVDRLEALLVANPKRHRLTPLQQLRDAPTATSSVGIVQALERIERIRKVGVGSVDLSDLPASRLMSLARQAEGLWSANFEKFSPARRHATLLALVQHLERTATDDVLTIFEAIMSGLNLRGEQRRRKEALTNLPALRLEALRMREALLPVLDRAVPEDRVRAAILERLDLEALTATLERVAEYAAASEGDVSKVWDTASQTLSTFFVRLISDLKFEGTLAAKDVLEALRWLKRTSRTAPSTWGKPPRVHPKFVAGDGLSKGHFGPLLIPDLSGAATLSTAQTPRGLRRAHHALHRPQSAFARGGGVDARSGRCVPLARLERATQSDAGGVGENPGRCVPTHPGEPSPERFGADGTRGRRAHPADHAGESRARERINARPGQNGGLETARNRTARTGARDQRAQRLRCCDARNR
jgi:Domain of unknown function (DUF4158)